MAEHDSVWFRLGYTLEQARERVPDSGLRPLDERRTARKVGAPQTRRPEARTRPGRQAEAGPRARSGALPGFLQGESPTEEPWDAVIAAAATALIGGLIKSLPRMRRPGVLRLLRAGAAGAGAALLREVLRPLRAGASGTPSMERARAAALAGSARGLLYSALVEPRIPGPPVVRGAVYGWLEHLVSPWGGLTSLVGAGAPHRSVPFLADLLDDLEPGDDTLADHLLFGITLAALLRDPAGR